MESTERAKRLFFEALAHQEQGHLREAERLYLEALALVPGRPSIIHNLAAVYLQQSKYEAAKALCEARLALDPQDTDAHIFLGIALINLDAEDQALMAFDNALAVVPNHPHALANRAIALLHLNRPQDALESCKEALLHDAGNPDTLNTQGNALLKMDRTEDALRSFDAALSASSAHVEASSNLGSTLMRLGREDEAERVFQDAIERHPNDVRVHVRFGDFLRMREKWDAATACYTHALALDPRSADAQFGLSCIDLFHCDYANAWGGFERRFETKEFRLGAFRGDLTSFRLFRQRTPWGGPLSSSVGDVAIWAEQGIGEELLYSTLLTELSAASIPVVYEVDKRLLALYQRAHPKIRFVARRDPPDEEILGAAYALAAGSLAGYFRKSRSDFARQPRSVIQALPERVTHYRRTLEAAGSRLNVALSWRSARDHWWARRKNTSLEALLPILRNRDVQFVDVQYGDTRVERNALEASTGVRIERFEDVDHFNDLEELCAIIQACDLVITTSNATAHFAGALGKDTWVLFPDNRPIFHYWSHTGDHRCMWYPTVEIMTGSGLEDWPSVIRFVADKLQRLAERQHRG